MDASTPLRWAVLGTGKIASIFCESLRAASMGERVVAVGSRQSSKAEDFCLSHGLTASVGTYDDVIASPDVDVVYIATPHPTHGALIAEAARHGKHVLCEKPLTVNLAEAEAAVAAVREHGVTLVEGFAYRFHPQTARMLDLLGSGGIGELRFIDAAFGYDAGPEPSNYLHDAELAGGSILDVGCYTMSMVRLLARVASPSGPAEPEVVTGAAAVDAVKGVDLRAVCSLRFESGLVAQLSCAIDANLGGRLRIVGSRGEVLLDDPWLPGRSGPTSIDVVGYDGTSTVLTGADDPELYLLEALEVERRARVGESPMMTVSDTLANMAALDDWRRAVGLTYPADVVAGSRSPQQVAG